MRDFLRVLLAASAQIAGIYGAGAVSRRLPQYPLAVGAGMVLAGYQAQRMTRNRFIRNALKGAVLFGALKTLRAGLFHLDRSNVLGAQEKHLKPLIIALNRRAL